MRSHSQADARRVVSCTTAKRLEFWADPDSDVWELFARYLGEEGNGAGSRNVTKVTFHEDYRSCGEMPATDRPRG